jgi:hypothetical protein
MFQGFGASLAFAHADRNRDERRWFVPMGSFCWRLVGHLLPCGRGFVSEKAGAGTWEGLMLRVPTIGPLVAQVCDGAVLPDARHACLAPECPSCKHSTLRAGRSATRSLVDAVSDSIERVQAGGRLGGEPR